MPADKPKAKKQAKASGVPAKPDHPEDATVPTPPAKRSGTTATKAAAETTPAMSTPRGKVKATADAAPGAAATTSTPNGKVKTAAATTGKVKTAATPEAAPNGTVKTAAATDGTVKTAAATDATDVDPDATAPDEEEPPANPLEALRRAQAKRVPPPGTQPRFGGSGTRGGNLSAPRHYNRHK